MGGGIEQREKGLMDMDTSGVIVGGKGSTRRVNDNGKKYKKIEK